MAQIPVAPAPAVRGAVVAAVGLGLGIAGHAYVGGGVLATPLLVLVGLLVVAACTLGSKQRWTTGRLLAALAGMQLVTHAVLWFEGGARTVDSRLGTIAPAGTTHLHQGVTAAPPLLMVLAHGVALVVAAVLLSGIDGAVAVLQTLARRLRRPVVAPLPGLAPPRRTSSRRAPVARPGLGAVRRRGPPRALALS